MQTVASRDSNSIRLFPLSWIQKGPLKQWVCGHVQLTPTDWSFKTLFDATIHEICPLAESTHVSIELSPNAPISWNQAPDTIAESANKIQAEYTLNRTTMELDLGVAWTQEPPGALF